jgi:hypothetical protein
MRPRIRTKMREEDKIKEEYSSKPTSSPKQAGFGGARIAISSFYILVLLIFWFVAILVVWPGASLQESKPILQLPIELQYLLLVTSGGALGSGLVTLLSLSSILDQRFEQRRILNSWMWRYLLLNMLFAIPLAVGLFVFVRGFLLRTDVAVTDFSPYGLLFASVLVGFFANPLIDRITVLTRLLSGKEAQVERQIERIGTALGVATLNNYEGFLCFSFNAERDSVIASGEAGTPVL